MLFKPFPVIFLCGFHLFTVVRVTVFSYSEHNLQRELETTRRLRIGKILICCLLSTYAPFNYLP